jgi:hypothetical protein
LTLTSVVRSRLAIWRQVCDAWGLEIIPPFTRAGLQRLPPGLIAFRAVGMVTTEEKEQTVSLSVVETWVPGFDELGDRRVEAEGCHVILLSWHLQIGPDTGASEAERLDVIPNPDPEHPRIHRHPYGAANALRQPADLPPPDAWLHQVDETLNCLLSDGLRGYVDEADELD